jgi:hypothetical protein
MIRVTSLTIGNAVSATSHGASGPDSSVMTNQSQSEEPWRRNEPKSVIEGVSTDRSQFDPSQSRTRPTKQTHRSGRCGFERFRLETGPMGG